jgi:hypothetical protein
VCAQWNRAARASFVVRRPEWPSKDVISTEHAPYISHAGPGRVCRGLHCNPSMPRPRTVHCPWHSQARAATIGNDKCSPDIEYASSSSKLVVLSCPVLDALGTNFLGARPNNGPLKFPGGLHSPLDFHKSSLPNFRYARRLTSTNLFPWIRKSDDVCSLFNDCTCTELALFSSPKENSALLLLFGWLVGVVLSPFSSK